MEDSTRELEEDDTITSALDSIEASATANPIPNTSQVPKRKGMRGGLPDVPPMMRTRLPASLLYFCVAILLDVEYHNRKLN
jgi:hypothetical protein